MAFDKVITSLKGGYGSGNFGHPGRLGKRGGSVGGNSSMSSTNEIRLPSKVSIVGTGDFKLKHVSTTQDDSGNKVWTNSKYTVTYANRLTGKPTKIELTHSHAGAYSDQYKTSKNPGGYFNNINAALEDAYYRR